MGCRVVPEGGAEDAENAEARLPHGLTTLATMVITPKMEAQNVDLKQTINLPKTAFSMKANLNQAEPKILERWEKDGLLSVPRAIDGKDVDWINDSAKALCLALAPREAARLAVATAEAVDRRVEALSERHVAANAAAGNPISLSRSEHRREHIDEIDRALGPSGAR